MPPQSRIGDIGIGICCCHPPIPCIFMIGYLVQGSYNHRTNTIPSSRLTDMVLGFCGHPGWMVTSSGTARINGLGAVRIGDTFAGCFNGRIVQGSPNTIVGG